MISQFDNQFHYEQNETEIAKLIERFMNICKLSVGHESERQSIEHDEDIHKSVHAIHELTAYRLLELISHKR